MANAVKLLFVGNAGSREEVIALVGPKPNLAPHRGPVRHERCREMNTALFMSPGKSSQSPFLLT